MVSFIWLAFLTFLQLAPGQRGQAPRGRAYMPSPPPKLSLSDSPAAVWLSENPLGEMFRELRSYSCSTIHSINDSEKITSFLLIWKWTGRTQSALLNVLQLLNTILKTNHSSSVFSSVKWGSRVRVLLRPLHIPHSRIQAFSTKPTPSISSSFCNTLMKGQFAGTNDIVMSRQEVDAFTAGTYTGLFVNMQNSTFIFMIPRLSIGISDE